MVTRTVLLCVAATLLSACTQSEDRRWGHASSEPSSSFTQTLTQGTPAKVSAFATTTELIRAVQLEQIDFAIIEQPASPIAGLTTVAPVFPGVLHVLVKQTINDCSKPVNLSALLTRGKIYAGTPGSTGYLLLDQLAAVEWLPPMSDLDVLDNPFGATPDIFFQFGGLLPLDAVRRLKDYCLASIGTPTELGYGTWAEGVSFRYPHLQPIILPAGLYPQLNTQAVLTLAVTSVLVTNPATNADLVYDIAQHVHNSASLLSEHYPLAGPTIRAGQEDASLVLPLHPGAERFIYRNAPSFLERYAELAALLLTAVIAFTSSAVAILRMRRQTKKDRIDEYLHSLLQFRAALRSNQADAANIAQSVQTLQGEVTNLVISERIEADSAYVAFLSLSNQVLDECRHPGTKAV